jgi:hypothetical protein
MEEFDEVLPPGFEQEDDDGLGNVADPPNEADGADGADGADEGIQGGFLPFLGAAYGLSKLIPLRKSFSLSDNAFFNKYRNYSIGKMTVCRTPINQMIGKALNLITVGAWQQAVKKYGFDKVFHLFLILDLIPNQPGQRGVTAVFEKNETPRLYQMVTPIARDATCMPIQQAFTGSLFSFIQNTIGKMGDNFWRYNAFTNNCQNQILNALGANDLLTRDLQNFIKQDAEKIAEELPDFSKNIIQGITDTARRARTLVGRGLRMKDKHTIGI